MAKLSDYLKNIFFIILILQFAPFLFKSIKKQYTDILEPKTQIAQLTIKGMILDSTYYTKYLKKFFKNQNIKAILLRIDSPGGAAGSSEAIAHEIELLKKEFSKPIISLCENVCTSGSYYIAASTDYIIAPPSALIGSIGTQIPYQFKLKSFIEQFKIYYNVIKAGDYKTATDPFTEVTPEQNANLQALANSSYQNFIQHVAKNRHRIALKDASQWANGKLFTALDAVQQGLIDEIGSITNAITKIKKLAIIEGELEWVRPPTSSGLMSFFSQEAPDNSEELHSSAALSIFQRILNMLSPGFYTCS